MKLCYALPPPERKLLGDAAADIQYCAPYDLDEGGRWINDGWFVATTAALYMLRGGQLVCRYDYADITSLKSENGVGCGLLVVVQGDKSGVLLRYSMHHISRFAFISRGVRLLIQGVRQLVESDEAENYCPKCGHSLPGTSHCPHCDGRSHTLRRLVKLCKPHGKRIALISALLVVGAMVLISQQMVIRDFIDNRLRQPEQATLRHLAVFIATLVSIAVFNISSIYVRFRMTVRLGADITADLRRQLYYKIQQLSLSFIDRRKSGELINRIGHDTKTIQKFMSDNVSFLFYNIVIMTAAVIVMLVINWRFTLLILALVPVIFLVNQVFWRFILRIFRMQWRRFDAISNRLQDVISGIRVVKAYGREEAEVERFSNLTGRYADIQSYNEKFFSSFYPFLSLLLSLSTCLVVYFGGRLILGGSMSQGELVQFMGYANMLYGPLGWMSFLPRDIVNVLTSLERIGDVLDERPDQDDVPDAVDTRIRGEVTLDNVTFGYKSYEPVLEKINLTVKKGEMIGLVGPSGAGKSTLINLLMRLYDVDDGRLLIDGVDVRHYKQERFHSQIGVVLQEPFLFSGSIFNNIVFSKPDATVEEVIRAAKMANAHDFICKTPDGYNTRVGEHGYMLSGGERQRISIARAILNDPAILILDEATSSLDTESEFQIQEALNRLIQGRTTFSIAHRLSTLRNADRIMVIDNNTCAELGSHDELLRKKGIYYNLVMAQLQTHKVRT